MSWWACFGLSLVCAVVAVAGLVGVMFGWVEALDRWPKTTITVSLAIAVLILALRLVQEFCK